MCFMDFRDVQCVNDTRDPTKDSQQNVDAEITVKCQSHDRHVILRLEGRTYAPTPRSNRTPRGGRIKARMILRMSL